jgi:cyclase
MNNDGVRQGYDIAQLKAVKQAVSVPVIASGGAGDYQHFADLFQQTDIDGALAASVFHSDKIPIPDLKAYLKAQSVEVRA